jgi:hypothetical protein
VIEYPIPGAVKDLANMFRASERMFWPVFYVLVLAIIIGIVTEYSKPVAVGLLSCALIVQVVDTSAAWLGIRNWLMAPPKTVWSTPLAHPFWSETAVKYKKVRHIPPGNHSKNWMPLADYASKHQLATDAVYLARVSSSELGQARRKAEHALWTGAYDADAIYVLSDAVLRQAAITLRPEDALAKVDGINILAPGWRSCGKCSPLESQVDIFGLVPKVRLGESIAFGIDGKGLAHTLGGWHLPEGQGTWSSAKSAELIFLVPDNARGLQLDAVPLVSPRHPSQKVVIKINDIPILTRNLSEHDGEIIQLDFPGALRKKVQGSGVMRIQFEFENAARPKDIGVNADRRRLAINIRSVAFY